MLNLRRIAVLLSVAALSVSAVRADVVSYFNFDSGNYVNSQLTPTVSGSPTAVSGKYDQALDYAAGDRWVFTGDQLVKFLSSIDKTCTVSFWAKSNSDTFSTGQYKQAFWLSSSAAIDANLAANSQNYRNMFTHYAYDNGNHLYFDSGITGYDRIDTNTTTATYPTDEWVHWAYVKDANAGTMRVYRNGVELVSGGNKKRSIEGIVAMTIANDLSVQMDDFVVDNKALSSGEILQLATSQTALVSDVMNRSLSNASMEISPGGIGTVGTMRFIQQQNMAYGRGDYASQSSTTNSAPASRAVDGNTNTTWGGGSMIHTSNSLGEWWQVQFSDTDVPVDKVTIWNRSEGNGCDQRLGNFTMNFYTENPTENASATPVYSYTYSGTFPGGSGTIDLPDTFNASWVRITNGIAQPLNISEVQVYTPTDNGGFSATSNNGAMIDGKNYQSYNLTLSNNSVLTMDIDSTGNDKLSVSGALTMGGTLKLNVMDASAITAADIPNLLAANSFSGKFDQIIFSGDDLAAFESKNIVIRSFEGRNLQSEEIVHWIANPEDKNFANVNNWSSNPDGQNVGVGLYGDEAADMTLDTSMSLGYMHFGYSHVVGNASLTLKNGANLSVTSMGIGENSRNTSTVLNVESGATLTDSGDLFVGHDGLGTLNVTGGTVTANKLRLGYYGAGTGVVNISGGEVTVNAESEIGNQGKGQITVSNDAKLTFNSTVRIANNGGGPSFINLEDNAQMSVKNLFVGQRGANMGSMTLSGNSKLTVTDHLEIGTDSGSKGSGTMTLKDNSVVDVTASGNNRVRIGYNAGTSTLNVSDNASFTVKGYSFLVADNTTGIINQSGGTINISTNNPTYTGDQTGGKAIFNISGGQFNVNNQFFAGTRGMSTINLSGTGEFN